jgi:prepilin-type N-terminal cleavage/methylation domain-containing protein
MLSKLKKSNSKGFTIIEVMIVLAIAGLIILIVLLAVPALQRSGRNTAMKSDATSISAAVNEFKSNNEGRTPNSVTGTAPDISITNTAAGSAAAQAKIQTGTTVTYVTAAPATYTTTTGTIIYVYSSAKCVGSNYATVTDLDITAGAARSVAVIYPVEQRTGAPSGRCIDS